MGTLETIGSGVDLGQEGIHSQHATRHTRQGCVLATFSTGFGDATAPLFGRRGGSGFEDNTREDTALPRPRPCTSFLRTEGSLGTLGANCDTNAPSVTPPEARASPTVLSPRGAESSLPTFTQNSVQMLTQMRVLEKILNPLAGEGTGRSGQVPAEVTLLPPWRGPGLRPGPS